MRAVPIILLLCTACGTTNGLRSDDLQLRTSTSAATPGDTVTLLLTNNGQEQIGYNLCPSTLSRESAGEWISMPSDRVCTMELRLLEPGASDSFRIDLPPGLQPGRYRLETNVIEMESDEHRSLATDAFVVE